MRQILTEYNVHYTDVKDDADARGWKRYNYLSKNPSLGHTSECFVFCMNANIFDALLEKWNRLGGGGWQYEKI